MGRLCVGDLEAVHRANKGGASERAKKKKNPFAPLKYLLFQATRQKIRIFANRSSINMQTYVNILLTAVIQNP